MGKLWIFLLFVAVATVKADDDQKFEDLSYSDYEDVNNYDIDGLSLLKGGEETASSEDKKKLSDDDYQIEDNRSAPKDDAEKLNDGASDENEFASDEDDNEDIVLDTAADKPQEKTDTEKISLERNDEVDMEVKDKKSKEDVVEEKKDEIEEINEDDDYVEEAEKDVIEMSKDDEYENIEGDTIDQVYDDLNEDLAKLMETWKKLNSNSEEPEKNADDSLDSARIAEYKDKFDDQVVEKDNNKTESIASSTVLPNEEISSEQTVTKKDNEPEDVFEDDADDYSFEDDDDSEDLEFSDKEDTIDKVADKIEPDDADNKDLFDDKETNDTSNKETEAIPYLADAISPNVVNEEKAAKMMNITDLNPEQYDQIMQQFKVAHEEELDISHSEAGRNVAPVRITLSLDETTVVTSPNYPMPYPTNNIIDWIFTGDGVGIELNITSFAVNGVLGDYLLVKPGGVDASGTDGIVFSYRLTSPRKYRFLDVDQMFVRFQSMPGMPFTRGFMFTARMISPRLELNEDIEPEPEIEIPTPAETLTLFVGGMTLPEFRSVQEDFRRLIADMATFYITANNIPLGLNSTNETTQITRTSVCNIHWPDFEQCSEVSFGVPLVYADEEEDMEERLTEDDLRKMWDMYSEMDPFAARLERMGIAEFTIPDDSGVLTLWVVLAVAILVCMALFALAMWRFSCFDNYSRMPVYSDRDSTYSGKQGQDLYPTPHQTLPPLYAENEYKWDDAKFEDSTRVDLGGFTNKSYTRDMYDIDSDEEVITPRDRYTTDV